MGFISRLQNILPGEQKAARQVSGDSSLQMIGGGGVTIYPANTGKTYIQKGYNKNAQVYTIVSKNARKFGQVPFYHVRIKPEERKTWQEYRELTRKGLTPDNIREAKKMRSKALDESKVDSELSKLLAKPNRNETGAFWLEKLYGFKQLTGEGNLWLNKGQSGKEKPKEMFVVPKGNLQLKTGSDIWSVSGYQIQFMSGYVMQAIPEQVIMWLYPTYESPNPATLAHLRGQAPLDAGILTMQALNEGAETIVKMNANQGAAGFAFNKLATEMMDPTKAVAVRKQFNDHINNTDMAGAIALMNGDWGYHQFGLDAQKLQLLEQTDVAFNTLCNIFDTPPGIFAKDQTYENQREMKRNWIYDNIAPAAYSLRDELNEKLILQMGLDRTRDFIDCDILGLPEMAMDLQKQIAAVKDAYWLSMDEKRIATGYEPNGTPESKQYYVPNNLTTLEEINNPTGGSLDSEVNLLDSNHK